MAVKIVRQANKIALLGAPTSAAAMSVGHEGAPAALRAAGLTAGLREIGYDVADLGDDPVQLFKPDEESPRARNLSRVIASLEALKPRVEQAVKSSALPLILSGDCSIALATVAGARRYFRKVSLIYMDGDADLNTPATTPSGCVDGMVVSHLTGRGAAEMVRFWGEPPLVREPDLALFGVARLDPPEEQILATSPLRRFLAADVKRMGPAAAAHAAIDRIKGNGYQFVLHLDVDVISDFLATNYPGAGGLSLHEVREALLVFVQQKELAALEVTAYNPTKDPDGSGAKLIVDLLAEALGARLEALKGYEPAVAAAAPAAAAAAASQGSDSSSAKKAAEPELSTPSPGEAWSSESLEEPSDLESDSESTDDDSKDSGASEESSGSHS
ncbi:MAG TPA: arginase family protein [Candidatus Acidoferrales bacterium]|nr:arginase family protein [Candidatus Acidoferrales bacterium]